MATANDVEDLVTCGVCLCEYDDVNRKPKFLQCAHTVCLLCLKEICKGELIKCPFCRETFVKLNVESLPNNPYALRMLKFKENTKELPKPIEVVTTPLAVSWCLTCGSAEKPGCAPSGHSSVDMTVNTIRNLEGLLKLKEELLKMKDTGTTKLAMAIEERKKLQEQLSLVMKAVQCSEEEIKKLQDENNLRLTEWISMLERSGSKTNSQDEQPKKELFFTELMSLVEGSTTEDTAETLKQKMEKTIELYDKNLREATAIASEYDLRKKIKIQILLYDENNRRISTLPWLEQGFRFQPLCPALKGSQIRQDSLLVSHAVFSLLQRQKIHLKRKEPSASAMMGESQNKTVLKTEQQSSPCQSSVVSLPPPPIPSSSDNKFVLNNFSFFILRMFQFGNLKGEIVIRPVLMFEHRDFTQKLGEFCFKTQQVFCSKGEKAVPGVYVSFPMSNAQFQPVVPSMSNLEATNTLVKEKPSAHVLLANQVRIALVKPLVNKVTGWSFILPLEDFQNPKFETHVKQYTASQLFGRVINHQMMECVSKLSLTNKAERTGYTITLESQSPL